MWLATSSLPRMNHCFSRWLLCPHSVVYHGLPLKREVNWWHLEGSWNRSPPKYSIHKWIFPYKPSIYDHFGGTPMAMMVPSSGDIWRSSGSYPWKNSMRCRMKRLESAWASVPERDPTARNQTSMEFLKQDSKAPKDCVGHIYIYIHLSMNILICSK